LSLFANFYANPLSGNINTLIQFFDQSTGGTFTWEWVFGDGSPNSTVQNPLHTYTSQGLYTVSLIIREGSIESIMTKDHYINIFLEETGTGFVRDKGPSLIFD